MKPIKITAADETGKIELHPTGKGPGPMTIEGPCVVDAVISSNGVYGIVGVRYGDDKDMIVGEPKYKVGDIIKWKETPFLIRKIEDGRYNTLSLASGSSFTIS